MEGAPIRILIVTYGPLEPELGAAQVALNLAAALAARGHETVTWSPPPPPASVRWWQDWKWRRDQIEAFLAREGPFDALDLPVIGVSRRIARHAPVVARSTQPMLLYSLCDARAALRRLPSAPLTSLAHLLQIARLAGVTLSGWSRSAVLLCLGTVEREWMARRLPWTRARLAHYVNTAGREEQGELAAIRAERQAGAAGAAGGRRYLWIGRWAPHKGTERLLRFLRRRTAERPQDSFTLAGTGLDAPSILPRDLLAGGRVRVIPHFRRSELAPLLRAHDAGLFTSEAEGWGLSLNEMLESGLPVFATEAGGVRDLRPYFPGSLLPFPPPPEAAPEGGSAGDLEAYYRDFTWEAIAERYEREVLAALGPAKRRGGG